MSGLRWLLVLALLVPISASTMAQSEPRQVQIAVHADAANCVADVAPCYEVVEDGWGMVSVGDRLEIVFVNNATTDHALNIVAGANASDEGKTNRSRAFATLGPVPPGETVAEVVEVPVGTDTAYFFCHFEGHESQGLTLLRNVYPPGAVERGRTRGPGLDDPRESAAPAAVAGFAVMAAALLLRRARQLAMGLVEGGGPARGAGPSSRRSSARSAGGSGGGPPGPTHGRPR